MNEVRIRPATPEDIDLLIEINIRVWDSTYRGLIDDAVLDAMTPDSLRSKWERTLVVFEDRICLVAEVDAAVVGYVVCGVNRDAQYVFAWELYAIYVLAEFQGRGIGRQLFLQAVVEMKRHEVMSFVLFVLSTNYRTRKFYESFAPDFETTRTFSIGGKEYLEAGYGWGDIHALKS